MNFVRFGGLSPVKQDHYTTGDDKTFHNPPRKKGNYAFPYPYIELFLIGSTSDPGHISNKSKWLKDDNGNRIKIEDFLKNDRLEFGVDDINPKYIKLLKKYNIKIKDLRTLEDKKDKCIYLSVIKKPKIFKYDGEIWHHLGNHLKPHQIIETSGSWVKSDMKDYIYALKLEHHECKKGMFKIFKDKSIDNIKNKNPFNFYAKDHLEVFIEKI